MARLKVSTSDTAWSIAVRITRKNPIPGWWPGMNAKLPLCCTAAPLFADVKDFLLYDFFTDEGWVNEDVFAYSNRLGEDRALVVYHNRYADTRRLGSDSCAYAEKLPDGSKQLRRRTLGEGFGLAFDSSMFVAYRDAFTGLEHLHRAGRMVENGLHLELGAYKHSVLLDWRDLREDAAHPWGQLCECSAAGAASLDDALRDLRLKPAHDALRALLAPEFAERLAAAAEAIPANPLPNLALPLNGLLTLATLSNPDGSGATAGTSFSLAVEEYAGLCRVPVPDRREHLERVLNSFEQQMEAAVRIPAWSGSLRMAGRRRPGKSLQRPETQRKGRGHLGYGAGVVRDVCRGSFPAPHVPNRERLSLEALRLREPMAEAFQELGPPTKRAGRPPHECEPALPMPTPMTECAHRRRRSFPRRKKSTPPAAGRSDQSAARSRCRLADRRASPSGRTILR